MRGRKVIKLDQEPSPAETFSLPGMDADVWKTRDHWARCARLVKDNARSRDGKYHLRDTMGILDDYDLEAWLATGLPF